VLVVDDEPLMHVITSRVLDEAGFDLLNATDGLAAIELLGSAERVPALVITDMRMPRMGGAELGRWLAENHPGVPVLYVSGYAADQAEPPVAGSDRLRHWLSKPFSPEQLLTSVRALSQRTTSLHLHGT
jgi:two-component system, cell cycle sensor histidine kinase and response regulator CckA